MNKASGTAPSRGEILHKLPWRELLCREKELAHVGIIANPLEDVYTNCHACHPDDYWQRAETFAVELNITPSSRATPTFVPTSDPASRQPTILILPPAGTPPLSADPQALFLVSLALATIIGMSLLGFLIRRANTQ